MPKKKRNRYIPYNIYGEKGRVILATSKKQAIRKAPKNSEKILSEKYLLKRYGKIPEFIL